MLLDKLQELPSQEGWQGVGIGPLQHRGRRSRLPLLNNLHHSIEVSLKTTGAF